VLRKAGDITGLLRAYRQGDEDAIREIFSLVYEDLRRIAHRTLRRAKPGATMGTTGLVHEAYLKIKACSQNSYCDRSHFLAVAAQVMRQIFINYAIKWSTAKRGGDRARIGIDGVDIAVAHEVEMLVSLNTALDKLAAIEERLVRVVECRFFAGLTEDETAEALKISARTEQRDWMRARTWLRQELG
jgi:RNA polymerase sigma factor (TIGR02999 family)